MAPGKAEKRASREATLTTDQTVRAAEDEEDILYVGGVEHKGSHFPTFPLMVGAPCAAILIAQKLTGQLTWVSVLYIFPFIWSYLKAIDETKKARYIIRKSGFEWITPGLSGGVDRIYVEWNAVLWVGPFPKDQNTRKQLEREFKLSMGRIRRIPATASINGAKWRVIHRGKRLTHAIDFFPSAEFLDVMKATAPAHLFQMCRP